MDRESSLMYFLNRMHLKLLYRERLYTFIDMLAIDLIIIIIIIIIKSMMLANNNLISD